MLKLTNIEGQYIKGLCHLRGNGNIFSVLLREGQRAQGSSPPQRDQPRGRLKGIDGG